MNRLKELISRSGLEKIAFFLMLVMTIFMANTLVVSRNRVVLGSPIELAGSGLSVCPVIGSGWQHNQGWEFKDRSYQLSFARLDYSAKATTAIKVIYHLANDLKTGQQYIQQKFNDIKAVDKATVDINGLSISYLAFCTVAEPANPGSTPISSCQISHMIGFLGLGSSRVLEILVESNEDYDRAMNIFKTVMNGIKFKKLIEIEQGLDFAKQLINSGKLEKVYSRERFYLTSDPNDTAKGFHMDQKRYTLIGGRKAVTARSFDYIDGPAGHISNTAIEFVPGLTQFKIKSSERWPVTIRDEVFETVYKFPSLKVINLTDSWVLKQQYNHPVIPAHLYREISTAFLDSGYNRLQIDIMDEKGRIIPTILKKKLEDIVVFKSLDGTDAVKEVSLNRFGETEKIADLSTGYVSDAVSRKKILKLFPRWNGIVEK